MTSYLGILRLPFCPTPFLRPAGVTGSEHTASTGSLWLLRKCRWMARDRTTCHHRQPGFCLLPQAVRAATCILGMGRTICRIFHNKQEAVAAPALPDLHSSSCFNSGSGLWFSILPPPLHKGNQNLEIPQKTPYISTCTVNLTIRERSPQVQQDVVGEGGIRVNPRIKRRNSLEVKVFIDVFKLCTFPTDHTKEFAGKSVHSGKKHRKGKKK